MNLVNRKDKHSRRNHPNQGAPASSTARAVICSVFLLALCVVEPHALSAEKGSPVPASPPQPVQAVNPSVNAVTQATVNAGALSCTSRINQVINFLAAGSQGMGAQVYVPSVEPDRKMISVSLEIQNEKDMPPAFASASFAPNQANGCGAMYETVVYWPSQCKEVASKQFAEIKEVGKLRQLTIVLEVGPSASVFLIPAGTGCISIKKEVVQ